MVEDESEDDGSNYFDPDLPPIPSRPDGIQKLVTPGMVALSSHMTETMVPLFRRMKKASPEEIQKALETWFDGIAEYISEVHVDLVVDTLFAEMSRKYIPSMVAWIQLGQWDNDQEALIEILYRLQATGAVVARVVHLHSLVKIESDDNLRAFVISQNKS